MSDFDITDDLETDLLERQVAQNTNDYSLFVQNIYKNLDECFRILEVNSKHHVDDGEDRITYVIRMFLHGRNIPCTFETYSNGHVDMTITENNFSWLAEAKIHKGNKWTNHGFKQLTYNYSLAKPGCDHGALIIYNKKERKNSKQCANEWREFLEQLGLGANCQDWNPNGYFDFSIPEHPRSGNPYYVRSYFVNLQYTESDDI